MSDARISGTAMSFSRLMKMVPNGAIQYEVNFPHPEEAARMPNTRPRTRPMMICQWSLRYQGMGVPGTVRCVGNPGLRDR